LLLSPLPGSELAASLATKGVSVTHTFEETGHLSKILPAYLSDWVRGKVEELGVNVIASSKIESVRDEGDTVILKMEGGDEITADHVVVCDAVSPNVPAGLVQDEELGGVLVNEELYAGGGVYSAGDVASYFDTNSGIQRRLQHHVSLLNITIRTMLFTRVALPVPT
jgi:programmed cell death 8 (apoptosis-inducing factor)